MTLSEKIFALHAVFPFSQLGHEELLIAAGAFHPRQFQPRVLVCPAGEVINKLYVRMEGDLWGQGDQRMHDVVGTTCLLTGKPSPFDIHAGPSGYRGLVLQQSKFFTLMYECPALLNGFFKMPLLGIDFGSQQNPTKP